MTVTITEADEKRGGSSRLLSLFFSGNLDRLVLGEGQVKGPPDRGGWGFASEMTFGRILLEDGKELLPNFKEIQDSRDGKGFFTLSLDLAFSRQNPLNDFLPSQGELIIQIIKSDLKSIRISTPEIEDEIGPSDSEVFQNKGMNVYGEVLEDGEFGGKGKRRFLLPFSFVGERQQAGDIRGQRMTAFDPFQSK